MMIDTSTTTLEWILFALAALSVGLPVLGARTGVPLFLLLGRWARWIFFGGIFAYLLRRSEISFRPDWVHFVTGLAVWFLLETGYNWIFIKALSRSELPLFPTFHPNREGDEWPADRHLIGLREWLRAEKFNRLSALKAKLFEGTYLRSSVYESADRLTRLQILFIPKRKGGATACYTLVTNGKEGRRLITDNMFLPFGGYYPEAWSLCRKPLTASLVRLLSVHRKRLRQSTIEPVPFEGDALEEVNDQQRILERLNMEAGFLLPRGQQEAEGKISYSGRYRLWKEMWLLAYFGRPVS